MNLDYFKNSPSISVVPSYSVAVVDSLHINHLVVSLGTSVGDDWASLVVVKLANQLLKLDQLLSTVIASVSST